MANTNIKEINIVPKARMSEENLQQIENRIDGIFSTARRSTMDIVECIGVIGKYNGFALKGYTSLNEYCKEQYEIKNTQANQMIRLFERYAEETTEGYRVPDTLKEFGAEKLDILQRFPRMPKQGNVVSEVTQLIEALDLKATDNVATFKVALKQAKGIEDKTEDKTEDKAEDKTEDKTEENIKVENDKKQASLDTLATLIEELENKANDDTLSDKDFRKQVFDIIKRMKHA